MNTQLINQQGAQVNAFLQIVSVDSDRSARLKETNSDAEFCDTAVQLAQDLGFSFSDDDVRAYFQQIRFVEAISGYSEDDLNAIAGSMFITGCQGPITTIICTPKSQCWSNSCC